MRGAWPEGIRVGKRGARKLGDAPGRDKSRQMLHLISWAGLSAFWVLKTSASCSSRCPSCPHTDSLLQMKDSGRSLNTL